MLLPTKWAPNFSGSLTYFLFALHHEIDTQTLKVERTKVNTHTLVFFLIFSSRATGDIFPKVARQPFPEIARQHFRTNMTA